MSDGIFDTLARQEIADELAEERRLAARQDWVRLPRWHRRNRFERRGSVNADGVFEYVPGEGDAPYDDLFDPFREWRHDGYRYFRGPFTAAPLSEGDDVASLILRVFGDRIDVPAAEFIAAAKAKGIPKTTLRLRAFKHMGIISTHAKGMGAGRIWHMPDDKDYGRDRAASEDIYIEKMR